LGLTATAERPDGQPVLDFFQDSSHRMTLEEAVRKGELVRIRRVRVKTNVDLSDVRFNQVQYNPRDIEAHRLIAAREIVFLGFSAVVSGTVFTSSEGDLCSRPVDWAAKGLAVTKV
jgi:superfamily II DNA or RNA helicase